MASASSTNHDNHGELPKEATGLCGHLPTPALMEMPDVGHFFRWMGMTSEARHFPRGQLALLTGETRADS